MSCTCTLTSLDQIAPYTPAADPDLLAAEARFLGVIERLYLEDEERRLRTALAHYGCELLFLHAPHAV